MSWLIWLCCLPLAICYSLAVRVRNLFYTMGWLRGKGLPCLVVSVGNLTVGGTGKTPTTLWLARELALRGRDVAILSRGYKGKGGYPMILEPGSDPAETASMSGDEPTVMASLYGQRVGVGKNRYSVGSQLFNQNPVDVCVLDDGFQHRRLRRDLDIVLLGRDWRGWVLPAGPFREPRGALRRAHRFLITGSTDSWQAVLAGKGQQSRCLHGALKAQALVAREDARWIELPLQEMAGCKVLALSGIADTRIFYQMIQDWGAEIVDTLEFPDHHDYSIRDWQEIGRAARGVDRIITTEKDLVKLVRFPFARDRLYALRVVMAVKEADQLLDDIEALLRQKRADAGKAGSVRG